MPKLTGAEAMAKAEMALERGNYSKRQQAPKTLAKTPDTHLPPHSLPHSSLLQHVLQTIELCQKFSSPSDLMKWWNLAFMSSLVNILAGFLPSPHHLRLSKKSGQELEMASACSSLIN